MVLFIIFILFLLFYQIVFLTNFEKNTKWSYVYDKFSNHTMKLKGKKKISINRGYEYARYVLHDLFFNILLTYIVIFCLYNSIIHIPSDLWYFISSLFFLILIPKLIKNLFIKKLSFKIYYYMTFIEKVFSFYNFPLILLALYTN